MKSAWIFGSVDCPSTESVQGLYRVRCRYVRHGETYQPYLPDIGQLHSRSCVYKVCAVRVRFSLLRVYIYVPSKRPLNAVLLFFLYIYFNSVIKRSKRTSVSYGTIATREQRLKRYVNNVPKRTANVPVARFAPAKRTQTYPNVPASEA